MTLAPLGNGRGTRIDGATIVATFPLGASMAGWTIHAAAVDETGHLLALTFRREESP